MKRLLLLILISLVFLTYSSPSAVFASTSDTWVLSGVSEDETISVSIKRSDLIFANIKFVSTIDPRTLLGTYGKYKIWIKTENHTEKTVSQTLWEIDLENFDKKYRTLRYIVWNKNGQMLDSSETPNQWTVPFPDTLADGVLLTSWMAISHGKVWSEEKNDFVPLGSIFD